MNKEMNMKNNRKKQDFCSARKALIRPFTYIADSVSFEATKMIVLLSVQILLLFISKSYQSLIIIAAAVIASVGADFISRKIFTNKLNDDYSLVINILQGMITGMLIPQTYSPLTVFCATLCVMLVVKHFFGGFSYAWVNPAVFTVVVLWIVGARLFPGYKVNLDILSARNPSQLLIENGAFTQYPFDSEITDAINNSIFSIFKVSIPNGYVSLFWDNHSIIPAFRFNFITLLSSVIIFGSSQSRGIIPALFITVYLLLVRFVSPVFCNSVAFQGDIILALLTGGTLFFATFVFGWYGTTPVSRQGKIIYGILAGINAFLIAGPGTSPCGMVFAVLLTNIESIVIQQWENRQNRILLRKKLENYRKLEAAENAEL